MAGTTDGPAPDGSSAEPDGLPPEDDVALPPTIDGGHRADTLVPPADDASPPDDGASVDAASSDAEDEASDAALADAGGDGTIPNDARDAARDAGFPGGGPLDGQRWDIPCTGPSQQGPTLCSDQPAGRPSCPNDYRPVNKSIAFGGESGRRYALTIRLRGAAEVAAYTGGMAAGGHFYAGGKPVDTAYNIFGFTVSSPSRTYYVNAGPQGNGPVTVIDDTQTIAIDGGSTITMFMIDSDCTLIRACMGGGGRCDPFVVPDVSPADNEGQYIQLNVVSIATQ